MNKIKEATNFLSDRIKNIIDSIDNEYKKMITEIRIRDGNQIAVRLKNKIYYVTENSKLVYKHNDRFAKVAHDEMEESFNRLCNFSVYSYLNDIRNGYITLSGGHRVGFCATAVKDDDNDADNVQIRNRIEGDGRHVIGHTPEIAAVCHIGLPVGGMVEMQGKLTGLLGADVLGDLVNVVHQSHGIAESIGIDVLHQERLGLSFRQHEIDFISTVYVAHLDGFVTEIFVFNPEESADFQQLVMKIHTLLLSVFLPKWSLTVL